MPHFVLDCSQTVIESQCPESIMQLVYKTAESTGLFYPADIKVRINPFELYMVGNSKENFIHIFANIMEGRTTEQKANLSRQIVLELKAMFPEIPIISINIRDFEKATYCN
ncbi:5-carboxymethyl-2-hydroxymuconate Delta-isomerase [Allomuricauda sp. M10]|uniref:5-carboxymethyl-2-hydroxymuconate Delta-isomerase n=1 Tax=Allomuricauda sp. M10 TaxID=2683292 RepID=UPI001D1815D7|nr:5-carboxymethyl-2-hydroxymuconate Delta-isomerase [Muricauda sp. M10]